jgi:hypothetical protein
MIPLRDFLECTAAHGKVGDRAYFGHVSPKNENPQYRNGKRNPHDLYFLAFPLIFNLLPPSLFVLPQKVTKKGKKF